MKLECVISFITNGQLFIIPSKHKACSERVLMQLCNQFPDFVVPLLISTFEQVARKKNRNSLYIRTLTYIIYLARPSLDLDSVVQKEALYCAIGRCAIRLKNVLQFDVWLQSTFFQEAHDSNPMSVFHQNSTSFM